MAVVLLAMGGYGSYLGWQIRVGEDAEAIAKAEDLHPKVRPQNWRAIRRVLP